MTPQDRPLTSSQPNFSDNDELSETVSAHSLSVMARTTQPGGGDRDDTLGALLSISLPCKPRRPLSAYNLFFQHERRNILQVLPARSEGKPTRSHGKIGFAALARCISVRWKDLGPEERSHFERMAKQSKELYRKQKAEWMHYLAQQALTPAEDSSEPQIVEDATAGFTLQGGLVEIAQGGTDDCTMNRQSWTSSVACPWNRYSPTSESDIFHRYSQPHGLDHLAGALDADCRELLMSLLG